MATDDPNSYLSGITIGGLEYECRGWLDFEGHKHDTPPSEDDIANGNVSGMIVEYWIPGDREATADVITVFPTSDPDDPDHWIDIIDTGPEDSPLVIP